MSQQLDLVKRHQIEAYLRADFSQKVIAERIAVDPATISREIRRNKSQRGYRAKKAQELADQHKAKIPKARKLNIELEAVIIAYIKNDYSPEQITGILKKDNQVALSHERIYQYIWADKATGGTLYTHLRRSQKKYKKRYGKKDSRGSIVGRVSIDKRPPEVDEKNEQGHWEIDLVVGGHHKGFLVTAVERVSKFTLIGHSQTKDSKSITAELIRMLKPCKDLVLTITADNGKEFAGHKKVSLALNADFYFAHPYHSWERGLNENTNGLIRQYFPKGCDLRNNTQDKLNFVMNRLNTRPRKTLSFDRPCEMIKLDVKQLALVN